MKTVLITRLFTALLLFAAVCTAQAQSTAFTYQGRLSDNGAPANGLYDLQFTLKDALSAGNTVSTPHTLTPVGVTNGLFMVTLDFGAGVFDGSARWLEIGVRTNGGGAYTTLNPRQSLTAVPYALYAFSTGGQTNGVGIVAATKLVLGNGGNSWDFGKDEFGNLAITYGDPLTHVVIDKTTGVLSGNGAGLTNVSTVPKMQVFDSPGTFTFTVPTNVTRIMVEIWGGGAAGSSGGFDIIPFCGNGGGAGGYGKQILNVLPGQSYSVIVGKGGVAGVAGGDGEQSQFAEIYATGGKAYKSGIQEAFGGYSNALVSGVGGPGQPEAGGPGSGGAAVCGGGGGSDSQSVSGVWYSGEGRKPGGGGCGGQAGGNTAGASGGDGRVIVYY